MNANNNTGQENTENSFQLLKAAQRDIITVSSLLNNDSFPLNEKVETICRSAAESAEKMLKAFILHTDKNIKVFGNHDLNSLNSIAMKLNTNFKAIDDNLDFLNNYSTELRYNSKFTIEPHEVKQCLKALKSIYDFPLIKDTRDFINNENKFNVLPENIGALFGKYYSDNEAHMLKEQ